MMMWHTVVGANVCTRIMATCHAIIGSESNFFFKKKLQCTLGLGSLQNRGSNPCICLGS